MDPEKIIDGLSEELINSLKLMSKSKDIDKKLRYSEIVKNLCESLGVFLSLATDMMDLDFVE
ncbi:MAG: hypothetical protein JRJ12_02905 [Deltaproteobacteria bacterium]|nr:hypothetical protein [Deltaproteobacteria bacterium]MBW2070132.1 hypothetical protein [Deltaproteobacteria bacterium]